MYLLLLYACLRGLPYHRSSAKFLKNTRRFGASIRRRVRDFENLARSVSVSVLYLFIFYTDLRPRACTTPVQWNLRSFVFFGLWFVYLFINQTTGGLSDPSTLNINNNNNNKYHARRAGVNNRQVGHRASAKKFLLFTERDILRCVYRSAKRSVYTNFMFAFFWTGKMVPGWLGLIDYQPISGVSCDVYITWRTALVDYFICRFYHLTYYVVVYRV